MRSRSGFNFEAFLDGLTGAGLFGKLRLPGAPVYMIDPKVHSVEEIAAAASLLLQPQIVGSGGSPTHDRRVTVTGQRS